MQIIRTPDERFVGLPDYPFEPHYVDVDAGDGGRLRMHYLDEGPRGGEVVLLLHGEPSWSYLYRWMIPVLADAGLRAVALDLIGFGRSDKLASRDDYTYQAHVDWTWAALEAIGLDAITLVCQDWGGLIGLRLVGEHPDRFGRVIAANTFLPTGDQHPGEAFLAWQRYSQETPEFQAGKIVNGGCLTALTDDVVAAYDAPFPDDTYKEGARQFPMLVPTTAGPRGNLCAASTAHFCAHSLTPIPSPAARTQSCARKSPGRPRILRSPSLAPATSFRRTKAKSSPRWSPGSSLPLRDRNCHSAATGLR
jgi:haloalkane dehalogenase